MGLSKRTKLSDRDLMPFGKYKGGVLGSVPDDYWMWFLKQKFCDSFPELVEYANLVIEEE